MKILWFVILIVLGHFTLIYIFEKIFLNILKIFKNNNLVLNLKYLILNNNKLDKKKKENFLILNKNLKNSFNNEIFYNGYEFVDNSQQKKILNQIKKTYKNNLNYKNLKLKYKLIDFNKQNLNKQNFNHEQELDIFEMFRNDISINKKNYFINKKKIINNDNYIINNKRQLTNLNFFLRQKNKNFNNSFFLSNKTYNFNTLNFNWNKLNLFSISSKLKLSNNNNNEIIENLKIFLLSNFSYKYYSKLNFNYNIGKNYPKKKFEQMYASKTQFNKIKNTKNKIISNKMRWTTLNLFDNKYEKKFIKKLNIGQRINLWSLVKKKSVNKKKIILWIKNKYNLFNRIKKGNNKKIKWTKFNFLNITKNKSNKIKDNFKKLTWTINLFNNINKKKKWTKFNFLNISKNKSNKIKDNFKKLRWIINLFNIVNNKKKKIKWTKFNFLKITKNKLSLCNITSFKKKVKWLNFDLFNNNNKKKKKYWTKFHFFKIIRVRGEYDWSNIMSLNKKLKKFLKHKKIYYINNITIKKINQSILPYEYCYNEYLLDKKLNKKYENFKDFKNDLLLPNIIDNNPLIPFRYHIEYDKNDLLEYYYKNNVINFNKFSNIIIKNYNIYHTNKVDGFNKIYNNYDDNVKDINKIKYNSFNNKRYNFIKKKKKYFRYLNKTNNKKINFNDQLYTSEYLESIIKKPIIIPENNLNFLNWFFKFNFNSFIDGFFFFLHLYYYKIQIIFFNFFKILIIPNKIYNYFIYKIKKLYNYIIKNINETKSFYIYLNQHFIKIYYFIILKYILTPFFLVSNIFEKLQFIYQDFLIKNFDFYYIDLILIYLKTFI